MKRRCRVSPRRRPLRELNPGQAASLPIKWQPPRTGLGLMRRIVQRNQQAMASRQPRPPQNLSCCAAQWQRILRQWCAQATTLTATQPAPVLTRCWRKLKQNMPPAFARPIRTLPLLAVFSACNTILNSRETVYLDPIGLLPFSLEASPWPCVPIASNKSKKL